MPRFDTRLVIQAGQANAGKERNSALFQWLIIVALCLYFGWTWSKYGADEKLVECDQPLVIWCLGQAIAFGILAIIQLKNLLSQWLMTSDKDNLRHMKHQIDKLAQAEDDQAKRAIVAAAHMGMARQGVKIAKLGLIVSAVVGGFLFLWAVVGLVWHNEWSTSCDSSSRRRNGIVELHFRGLSDIVYSNSIFDVIVVPCLIGCLCYATRKVVHGETATEDESDSDTGSTE